MTVRAPAGYGKTTLLQQWETQDPRPFRWIRRDGRDDDATGLLRALTDQIDGDREARVLALDDPRAVGDAIAPQAVVDIALRAPPGSPVVLATRAELGLPIGLLRVRGEVFELGASELALTDGEAANLLGAAGVLLSPDALATLSWQCEGWAAGVRLAALAVGVQDDVEQAATRFDGSDRFVADYLHDVLVRSLPPGAIDFLRGCSILGELSGPLCDAVMAQRGSGELLRSLARHGLPLTALDRDERHFRLHPLLRAMLAAELSRRAPDIERELHRRAAAWHARAGDAPRAVEHALSAGEPPLASELIWRVAPAYASGARRRQLGDWLARCGEELLAADPGLALSRALERFVAGDRNAAEGWVDAAAHLIESPSPAIAEAAGAADGPLSGAIATLRAALAPGGGRRLRDDAAAAGARTAAGPLRPLAQLVEGAALRLLGEAGGARDRLRLAARQRTDGLHVVRCSAIALLALTELEAGNRADALALADDAAAELDADGLAREPGCALAYAAIACVHAETRQRDRARGDADRAARLLAELPDPAPWFAAESHVALAHSLLRLGDAAAARDELARAERQLCTLPDAAGLRARTAEGWERADSFAVEALTGAEALTSAELRVLRFLPSHLSFREIGGRLYVSTNTIKSQVHAIYRKLGASSRSEAVARATLIGLIDT